MEVWFPLEKLAVRGYVEVVRHLLEIVGIRRQLRRRFIADPPEVFIGIDAPDFNLDLEQRLKARGIPTVHYVSPSIWMWRKQAYAQNQARGEQDADAVSVRSAAVPAAPASMSTFVGHPLDRHARANSAAGGGARAAEIAAVVAGHRAAARQPPERASNTWRICSSRPRSRLRDACRRRCFWCRWLRARRAMIFETALYRNERGGPAADHFVRPRA